MGIKEKKDMRSKTRSDMKEEREEDFSDILARSFRKALLEKSKSKGDKNGY